MAEDIDASYPDLGSVRDSKEGGPDKLEEVEDRVDEEGQESLLSGAPLPKHFGHILGICWGIALGQGPSWQYQVLMDLISLLSESELSQILG